MHLDTGAPWSFHKAAHRLLLIAHIPSTENFKHIYINKWALLIVHAVQ